MKHRFAYPLAALLMAGSAVPASASLTTPQLVASAACPDCIDYRVVGVCYWLLCTPFGCSVKTSVKVRHFIRRWWCRPIASRAITRGVRSRC